MLEDENYPHFTDEETKAQRGAMTCSNGMQLEVVESSLESMLFGLPIVLLPLCLPSRSLCRVLVSLWAPRVDLLR